MEMSTPISDLYLGTKPYKALRSLGINNVGEFISLDLDMILELPGMGNRTKKRLAIIKKNILPSLGRQNIKHHAENDSVLVWTEFYSQLSIRTQKGLDKLRIKTPEAFLALTREKFLSIRNIGEKCWDEVSQFQKQLRPQFTSIYPISDIKVNDLSIAEDNNADAELLSCVKDILGTRKWILNELHIHSFSQLLNITYEEFIVLNHVGHVAWEKLQNAIHKAISKVKVNNAINIKDIKLENFPLFGGIGVGNQSIPQTFYPEAIIGNLPLSPRSKSVLKKLQINNMRSLLMASPDRLLKQNNFGDKSLKILRQSIKEYLDYWNNNIEISTNTGDSLEEYLWILCELSGQSKRHYEILIGRIHGTSDTSTTLNELGQRFGYTRERIRQIIKTIFRNFCNHFQSRIALNSLQNSILHILDDYRGMIGLDELGVELTQRMNWLITTSANSLQEIFNYILSDTDISVQNSNAICNHPCRECQFIVEHLGSLIRKETRGKLSFSYLTKPDILCVPNPDRGCPVNSNMKYSREFLHELAERSNLICNGEFIYSKNALALYRGGLNRKVTAILDMLGTTSSPENVWNALYPYLDEPVSIEKVHSALINAEDSHIWGRGKFTHKDHININCDVLPSLKDILLLRLRNTPFLALHGVFTEFRTTFEKAGIPNEYALSTVIDLFLEEFHVDRYRYVYMKKPSKSTSIDEFIEKWIQDQGGEIMRSDLERYLMDQIGVRQSVVQLSLGRLNSVVVTKKGYLVHIDNTGLTSGKLMPIYRWIQSALKKHEHIGIDKLYKEQRVTCFQLRITSKKMLYAVLRYFFSDTFDFIQYPHITRQNQDTFNSLGEAVSEYVKQQKGIVAVEDCVQHFEAKGYSANKLRARICCLPKALPYYPGCIIHEETIGWSNPKADELYNILLQSYTSRIETGYLLGDLEYVFDLYEDKLPKLSNDMNWTYDLISAIASQYDNITLIGNMKRAYSVTCHEKAIHTLEDLVVKVVRDLFSGGCNREQMNEWMQDNGVVCKQLTENMFTAIAGLVITEYEYIWEGESHE